MDAMRGGGSLQRNDEIMMCGDLEMLLVPAPRISGVALRVLFVALCASDSYFPGARLFSQHCLVSGTPAPSPHEDPSHQHDNDHVWRPIPGTRNLLNRPAEPGVLLARNQVVTDLSFADRFARRKNFTRTSFGYAYEELPPQLRSKAATVITHDNPYWDDQTRAELQRQQKQSDVNPSTLPPNLRFLPVKNRITGGYDIISFNPPTAKERNPVAFDEEGNPTTRKRLVIEIGANSRNLLMDEDKRFVEAHDDGYFLVSFEPLLDKWSYLLSRFREPSDKFPGRIHQRGVALPHAVGPCKAPSGSGVEGENNAAFTTFNVMQLDGASSMLEAATVTAEDVALHHDPVKNEDGIKVVQKEEHPVEIDAYGNPVFKIRHTAADVARIRQRVTEGFQEKRQVPCVGLETVLRKWFTGFDEVSTIKIDAQGMDLKIVQAALAADESLFKSQERGGVNVAAVELEVMCPGKPAMYEGGGTCEESVSFMTTVGFAAEQSCEQACRVLALHDDEDGPQQDDVATSYVDETNMRFRRLADKSNEDGEPNLSAAASAPQQPAALSANAFTDEEVSSASSFSFPRRFLRADIQITSARGQLVELEDSTTTSSQPSACLQLQIGTGGFSSTAGKGCESRLTLEPSLYRYGRDIARTSGHKADNFNPVGALSSSNDLMLPLGFCRGGRHGQGGAAADEQSEAEGASSSSPCVEPAALFENLVPLLFPAEATFATTVRFAVDHFRFAADLPLVLEAVRSLAELVAVRTASSTSSGQREDGVTVVSRGASSSSFQFKHWVRVHTLVIEFRNVACDWQQSTAGAACARLRQETKKDGFMKESGSVPKPDCTLCTYTTLTFEKMIPKAQREV